ncbi:MAG: hypothetical protein K6T77_02290 [candidate division WOR-3 bacterium]|nr:hypothetical protein [candidate division WOR-3 bacterium]MCR4423975.1 hypothetical protein [candidate division WOR-3 bacterium]MDH7519606.1 hypothetical protein [bacterium]
MSKKMMTPLLITMVALIGSTAWADAQFGFSVKPGMSLNAVQFGYKADNLFAGLGLEFASLSVSSKVKYEYGEQTYTYTTKVGGNLFMPQLGARYFFVKNEDKGSYVTPYIGTSLFYTFGKVSISESDGETTYRDTTMEKTLNDVLSGNIGGTLGFGGEYYLSNNFSIGGEFGIRMLFGGTKTKVPDYYYEEYTLTNNLGLGVTYTTLGLNFYF